MIYTNKEMTAYLSQAEDYFLEWVNDYLTIEKFAEHNALDYATAVSLIDLGRQVHHSDNQGSELH